MDRVILYHALFCGPPASACLPVWAEKLAYARRTSLPAEPLDRARSLLGIALALRGLTDLLGRAVDAAEIGFITGGKPRIAGADFSIAHAGRHVAVALRREGCIGLDLEDEGDGGHPTLAALATWLVREAVVKAAGLSLRAATRVVQTGERAWLDGRAYTLHDLLIAPDCRLCVASDGPLQQIEVRRARDTETLLSTA